VAISTGTLVFASDTLHFIEEVEMDYPFIICSDLPDVYRSLDLLAKWKNAGDILIAGHDRAMVDAYPGTDYGVWPGRIARLPT
jgi:uncharacterized protein with NRDE domain